MPSGVKVTKNTAKSALTGYSKRVVANGRVVIQRSGDRAYGMMQSLVAVRSGETKRKMRPPEFSQDGLAYKTGFFGEDFPPNGFVPKFLEYGTRDTPQRPCVIPTREAERPRLLAECREAVKP